MALVNCPSCGRDRVSDSAQKCPGCGFDVNAYYHTQNGFEVKKNIDESKNKDNKKTDILSDSTGEYVFDGLNGDILYIYEDRIIIKHVGVLKFLTQGSLQGDKTIYFSDITAIEYKKSGKISIGFIQFSIIGGIEKKRWLQMRILLLLYRIIKGRKRIGL